VIALVTGLPGGRSRGNVIPGEARGELEKDILQDLTVIERRAATGGGREKRLEEEPLGVGEEHGGLESGDEVGRLFNNKSEK
jgi:hypothetical protein